MLAMQPKRPPQKTKCGERKPKNRKPCAAEKAAAEPRAVQRGRLRAAALSVWFSSRLFWSGVCLAAAARSAAALVYA